jgi:hypothetical protein
MHSDHNTVKRLEYFSWFSGSMELKVSARADISLELQAPFPSSKIQNFKRNFKCTRFKLFNSIFFKVEFSDT